MLTMYEHPPSRFPPRACGSGLRLSGIDSLATVAHTACRVSLVSGVVRMLRSGSELSVFKESVCKLQLITARLPCECLLSTVPVGRPCRRVFSFGGEGNIDIISTAPDLKSLILYFGRGTWQATHLYTVSAVFMAVVQCTSCSASHCSHLRYDCDFGYCYCRVSAEYHLVQQLNESFSR